MLPGKEKISVWLGAGAATAIGLGAPALWSRMPQSVATGLVSFGIVLAVASVITTFLTPARVQWLRRNIPVPAITISVATVLLYSLVYVVVWKTRPIIEELSAVAGRRLLDDQKSSFQQVLYRSDEKPQVVFLMSAVYCVECSEFANDIDIALSELENIDLDVQIPIGTSGPPSGLTVYGDGCDDVISFTHRLVRAFDAAGFKAKCEPNSDGWDAPFIYITRVY